MVIEQGQPQLQQNTARMEERHGVVSVAGATVEFDYPQPRGRRRRLMLHDMSSAGICFTLPFHGLTGIDPSTHLLDVVVRIAGCEIAGELLVAHTTRESDERLLCGGRFYPATESDHLQMFKAIATLESRRET